MKYWSVVLLFLCLGNITTADKYQYRNGIPDETFKRVMRQNFNSTRPLKSVKHINPIFSHSTANSHPAVRVEHFETRLDHFSADDERTVQFVRK